MREQYEQYDGDLLKNDYINRHYECLPFIGENYENSRLLLIGESHYVPKDQVDFVKREDFYDISFDDLQEGDYKNWINTRYVVNERLTKNDSFKSFFSNPATEIAKIVNQTDDLSIDQKIAAMHQYAFMNYFKRPSYVRGKTIGKLSETDKKLAYDVSAHIINVLKPKLIIFISKKSFYAFCDSDRNNALRSEFPVKSVSHPSSYWWNRPRKDGKCAREDFYEYISAVLVKQ